MLQSDEANYWWCDMFVSRALVLQVRPSKLYRRGALLCANFWKSTTVKTTIMDDGACYCNLRRVVASPLSLESTQLIGMHVPSLWSLHMKMDYIQRSVLSFIPFSFALLSFPFSSLLIFSPGLVPYFRFFGAHWALLLNRKWHLTMPLLSILSSLFQ